MHAELQLRRPNKNRYRLDRLLEKKAKEGVKIYIILYQEVSSRTTPTDSKSVSRSLQSSFSDRVSFQLCEAAADGVASEHHGAAFTFALPDRYLLLGACGS